jgi:hypothetical protein
MPLKVDSAKLEKLIADAKASGGAERANYQKFITELCHAYGLESPHFTKDEDADNNYVFERRIKFNLPDGTSTPGWIDCYKRGHFILEAKQSPKRKRQRDEQAKTADKNQLSFFASDKKGRDAKATKGWDQIMLSARRQAEDYAKALPVEHGYPPFLLIVDVGHVIEVYADFSGQGKNYAHFPDRQNFRLTMDDLLNDKVQQRLAAIWTEPLSLDPTRISAVVTKDVAERLAKIATALEKKYDAKDVAEFLMRCLFTMFAEDAKLIPEKSFENLLRQLRDTPKNFTVALESLWKVMNEGGYAPHINTTLKKFNGGLFKDCRALPLEADQIDELFKAAGRGWEDVEPAIFGTLLERALNPRERSKLGAHYTPRTYVERLVIPTIIEPLRADWQEVQDVAADLQLNGKPDEALAEIKKFHHKLCITRVLDPACGTGNFLYVSLELMKKLEGDVLEALSAFGEDQARLALDGETVSPRQFYGLELNPRAVPIADLVLWLGYLKWQLKTAGLQSITEPVLHAYGTIKQQDAILKYDRQEVLKDERGRPLSRWDGTTKKLHPITGEEIPDPDAQLPLYKYVNPRAAPWPDVEFIVGNPPFIGGKDMRQELGDGYAESCWKVRPHIPGGADFVMHFWDQAAEMLLRKGTAKQLNPLRRFGFITTNSITQTFSRRVIEHRMKGKEPLSLVFAVPDHPWLKASDKAAVRIAMTVAVKGAVQGVLAEVKSEEGLDTDTPNVELDKAEGKIVANLLVGADVGSTQKLMANAQISSRGVVLHGPGFMITPTQASVFGLGKLQGLEKIIVEYRNGRDISNRPRHVLIIDLFGSNLDEVKKKYPAVYQHLLENVKPERDHNPREYRRVNWWLFGENIPEARKALFSIPRYITTIETAKHRFFQFLDASIRPDNKLVNIGMSNAMNLAVLSSNLHSTWSIATGSWMGVGNDPVYAKTETFDPFPFPDLTFRQALSDRLRELGERLDAFRKERLAAYDFLTMTGLYNALERYRELNAGIGEVLTAAERDVHEAGLISVLADIHDDIDRATLSAYGWDDLAPALVGKVGGTVPSEHKSEAQLEAEEILLTRLVALNHERAAEEKRGLIRWLRPEYQIPKLGAKAPRATTQELDLDIIETTTKPKWPTDAHDQIRRVRDILAKSEGLASADAISAAFDGRSSAARKTRVTKVLETLVITGAARTSEDGDKYFVVR